MWLGLKHWKAVLNILPCCLASRRLILVKHVTSGWEIVLYQVVITLCLAVKVSPWFLHWHPSFTIKKYTHKYSAFYVHFSKDYESNSSHISQTMLVIHSTCYTCTVHLTVNITDIRSVKSLEVQSWSGTRIKHYNVTLTSIHVCMHILCIKQCCLCNSSQTSVDITNRSCS